MALKDQLYQLKDSLKRFEGTKRPDAITGAREVYENSLLVITEKLENLKKYFATDLNTVKDQENIYNDLVAIKLIPYELKSHTQIMTEMVNSTLNQYNAFIKNINSLEMEEAAEELGYETEGLKNELAEILIRIKKIADEFPNKLKEGKKLETDIATLMPNVDKATTKTYSSPPPRIDAKLDEEPALVITIPHAIPQLQDIKEKQEEPTNKSTSSSRFVGKPTREQLTISHMPTSNKPQPQKPTTFSHTQPPAANVDPSTRIHASSAPARSTVEHKSPWDIIKQQDGSKKLIHTDNKSGNKLTALIDAKGTFIYNRPANTAKSSWRNPIYAHEKKMIHDYIIEIVPKSAINGEPINKTQAFNIDGSNQDLVKKVYIYLKAAGFTNVNLGEQHKNILEDKDVKQQIKSHTEEYTREFNAMLNAQKPEENTLSLPKPT